MNRAKRSLTIWALCFAICGVLPFQVWGAELVIREADEARKLLIIYLTGRIDENDAQKIEQLVSQRADWKSPHLHSTGLIVLNSDGGNFEAGIDLAKAFQKLHLATYVGEGATCLSACALAFLGGSAEDIMREPYDYVRRRMHPTARIGFHAPYTPKEVLDVISKGKIEGTSRITIIELDKFLRQFNVSPLVTARIADKNPGEFYFIDTVQDLFLFRIQVPNLDASRLDSSKKLKAVCRKLLAYRQGLPPTEVGDIIEGNSPEDGGYHAGSGRRVMGFQIDAAPYQVAFCGTLAGKSPTERDEIHLFKQGQTHLEITTTFFSRMDGWANVVPMLDKNNAYVALGGGLEYWYFDEQQPVRELVSFLRPPIMLNTNLALMENAVESQNDASLQSRTRDVMLEMKFLGLSIPTQNSLYDYAKNDGIFNKGTRFTKLTRRVHLLETIGDAELFDKQRTAIEGMRDPIHREILPSSLAASYRTPAGWQYITAGKAPNGQTALLQLVILDSTTEPLNDAETQLVRDVTCSAKWKDVPLPCPLGK